MGLSDVAYPTRGLQLTPGSLGGSDQAEDTVMSLSKQQMLDALDGLIADCATIHGVFLAAT